MTDTETLLDCEICFERTITKAATFKCDKHHVCKQCYAVLRNCPWCRSGKDKTGLIHDTVEFGGLEVSAEYLAALEEVVCLKGLEIHISFVTDLLRGFDPNTGLYL